MRIRSADFLGAIETVGRAIELMLAVVLQPIRQGLRRLWNGVLKDLFSVIADRCWPAGPKRVGAADRRTAEQIGTPSVAAEASGRPGQRSGEGGSLSVGGAKPARRWSWRVALIYLVAVAGWSLLGIMRRVDSALQQMHREQQAGGSALGFGVSFGDLSGSLQAESVRTTIADIRAGWNDYATNVADTATLRDPLGIAATLIRLDYVFILLYFVVAVVALVALYRTNAAGLPAAGHPVEQQGRLEEQQTRRGRMVVSGGVALLLLVVVDLLENLMLHRALVGSGSVVAIGGLAVGSLMSLLKLALTIATVAPPLLVAVILVVRSQPLRQAVSSARGVLIGIAALAFLLSIGIGAAQVDDVIRAWNGWRGLWAFVACFVLAGTVAGAIRRLTADGLERPAPDEGSSAQQFMLGLGVILVAIGAVGSLVGLGWGICVAGALLIGLWVLGLAFGGLRAPPAIGRGFWLRFGAELSTGRTARPDRGSEPVGAEPVGAGLVGAGLVGAGPVGEGRDGETRADGLLVAAWGDRLGRLAGAIVCALVVGVIARATALDAYTRDTLNLSLLQAPIWSAVAIMGLGLVLGTYKPVRRSPSLWTSLWGICTFVAFLTGFVLLIPYPAVQLSEQAGTMAILLGGFSMVIGAIGLLATQTRKSSVSRYALAPALRAARLKRFPVVSFLVAWVLVVSALDKGGYHDIRRLPDRPIAATPTIADAWRDYVAAHPPAGAARPVVMVGAQGGGIRAAVWTALVMECLFGPGPVAGSGETCARGSQQPADEAEFDRSLAERARDPLPVFLASGASGGSVGLAAWTARRADLVQDGAGSMAPRRVEDALDRDFVAPDIARLFAADMPNALLAWDWPDRAEMLERSWEQAWRRNPDGPTVRTDRGMARGLRDLWGVTHGSGQWASPILALNASSVEDGCRFVASAVDFTLPAAGASVTPTDQVGSALDEPDDAACRGPVRPTVPGAEDEAAFLDVLPSSSELVDYLCPTEDVPLSTAAHLSARFPFVSPSGRIDRRPCGTDDGLVPAPAVSYVADGGLFDNSGAGTATDAWRALRPIAAASENGAGSCLVPIFVQIDNSPPAATKSAQADPRPFEMLAPASATLGQVSSREAYARADAAAAFTRPLSAGGDAVVDRMGATPASLWFRITLSGQPGPEPPLGWTLATSTVNEMRSQLTSDTNRSEIETLRDLLKPGGLTCS